MSRIGRAPIVVPPKVQVNWTEDNFVTVKGPKGELKRRGIDVRLDLPGVGKNLQDHLHTRVRCEITQPLTFAPLPGPPGRPSSRSDTS